MAERFGNLYLASETVNDFVELITEFQERGISLPNPGNNRVTTFLEEGEQIEVTMEWLTSQIASRRTVNFQWWLSDSVDLYSRFRFLEDVVVEEYGLDGLFEELELITDALTTRFRTKARKGATLGIVIDSLGVTEEYGWDDFFIRDAKFDMQFPDILGIPSHKLNQIKSELRGLKTEAIDNYVILSQV